MDKAKFIQLLKQIEEKGLRFYDPTTECFNAATTVFYKCFTDEDLIENEQEELVYLKKLGTKEYFISKHWISISQEKLKEQPGCEGCGNKAYRVFKKQWSDKGEETLQDLVSLCNKCRFVDGEIISHKEVKQELTQYKDIVKNMVEDIIVEKAKNTLNYYQKKHI